MTQDQRIATIHDRLRTAASNVRFANMLAEHRRLLTQRETEMLSASMIEVIRELGALAKALDLGEAEESCP